MKKSVKILTLVLSLALLCGALVVAAFAEDSAEITGVKVDFSTDFTGATAYGDQKAQNLAVVSRNQGFVIDNKGSGFNEIVISEYDGNSYFSWNYTENATGTSGNYSYTAPNPGQAWGSPKSYETPFGGYYYTDNSYYAFDFDIYFPKDVPGNSVTAYLYNYVVAESVTDGVSSWVMKDEYVSVDPRGTAVKFTTAANGDVALNPVSGEKYSIVDGAWNHFTLIVEPVLEDGTLSLKTYTVLNGTVMDITDYTPATKDPIAGATDLTHWTPKTVRFEFGSADKNGNIVNVDNVAVRRFTKDYNGNLATVLAGGVGASTEAWESDLYDANNMPFATPVAYVGDVAYDALQKAVDAAEEGDTVTLCANTTNVVTVDKVITIECGEYTMPAPTTAEGYVWNKVGTAYEISETQAYVYIEWSACTCPICEAEADETHPGDVIAEEAYLNNTLAYYYEKAGKSTNWSVQDGNKTYTLVGWMDEDTEEIYELDAPITEEMVEAGLLYLAPVIEINMATVQYEKGGSIVYTSSFSTALSNVDADGTITLLANTKHDKTTKVTINKNVEIDLNGFVLDAFLPYHYDSNQYYTSTNNLANSKVTTFALNSGKTITFKGEKEGSAIISGSNCDKDSTKVAGTFITPGANSTINFIGANLNVVVPQLAATWGATGWTININGGYYNKNNASDGSAYIYGNGSSTGVTVNIENAVFNANIGGASGAGMVANVKNSVLVATAYASGSPDVTFNVSDSYIFNALKPNKVVLGENCYISDTSWLTAATTTYAPGVAAVTESNSKTFTNYTQRFAVMTNEDGVVVTDPSTLVFTKSEVERDFGATTIKGITVTFKDGETTLASVTSKAGEKVVGPTAGAAEPVADGWIMATKAYAYTIPTDATEDITVDIATVTEFGYTYAAGTPKLYANFGISDNLSTQLYVPATLPEGVVITDITLNGSNSGRTLSGNFTIGGVAYKSTQGWPCAWGADEGTYWVLTYTYEGATVTYKVTVDVVNYAKKVVDIYATDAEKIQQATALLQYVEAANKIKENTISNGLSETLAALKETVTLPAITTEYTADLTQLKQYISGAKVTLNPGRGGSIVLTVSAAAKEAGYGVKIVGVNDTVVGTNYKDGAVVVADTVFIDNTKIHYWAASDITINVYDAEGQVLATGTYSLAAYYNEMKDSMTADEISLAQAMYALAVIGDTNK